ncbi:MAG TPA: tyrosine-protein phosphatase [Steroidobacteraceae bacterium]|nr:tyrosine-protein phosphatase [Steroidobacteraceae bacterium]
MKSIAICCLAAVLAAPVLAQEASAPIPAAAAVRPVQWAEPVEMEGVSNLHRISPTLYRSEQPTALGMKNLEKLGIRTIINLRAFNDDKDEVKGTSLRTERVKILTWRIDDKHVIEVMRMLKKAENGPFLIHCQHGADRTGLMSAMYRVLEQGWTPEDALTELIDGGYGYHSMWKNIVRYVRSVDAASLREAIGSDSTSPVTDNL